MTNTEWKECTIGDIADVQTGPFGSQLHEKDYVSAGTPIVTVEHLGNRTFSTQNLPMVSDSDKSRLQKYCMKQGDLIFSRVGSVDRCTYANENNEGWLFSGRCLRVRPQECVDSMWLYYFFCLESTKTFIRNIAVGATMPSINTKLMCEVPVKYPPLAEQQRIAKILSTLDDKIELNNAINRNLEEQAQAIFKSWFIDFEPFGGEMPSDWENGKLSDLGTVVAGGTPSKARSTYYTDNGIAWITPKDLSLHPNKFTSKGEIDITQEGYDNSSAKIMPKGTVLFSSRAPIGYISIAQNEICTNQGFKSLVPKVNVGTPYVYFYLKNHTEEIENKASGSTFKEASGSLMNGLEAIIPSDQILSKFNSLCKPIFEQQESLELENQRLVLLRDNLLPKLMSGELDVADARI